MSTHRWNPFYELRYLWWNANDCLDVKVVAEAGSASQSSRVWNGFTPAWWATLAAADAGRPRYAGVSYGEDAASEL